MKMIYFIVLLSALASCSQKMTKKQIIVEYKNDNILINCNDNQDYIKIPFHPTTPLKEEVPAYIFDTLRNTIFIYVPDFGIKHYDLSNKKLIQDRFLEFRYHKRNHFFKLRLLNNYVVLTSYFKVLIFNKDLEVKADLRDTIERNLCPEFALHKYEVGFTKDTLLFKAMIVEKSDFEKNKRHKSILKDYEFVIGKGKIQCNNCDRCEKKNSLTKTQMEQLLKD